MSIRAVLLGTVGAVCLFAQAGGAAFPEKIFLQKIASSGKAELETATFAVAHSSNATFKQFAQRHALVAPEILADPIVDHDRVVDRIAKDREERRNDRGVEIELKKRENANREHDVVNHGHDRA